MTTYKAIIIEKTSNHFGECVANSKSSSKYKGMNKEQFIEATKYVSCFTIQVIELN